MAENVRVLLPHAQYDPPRFFITENNTITGGIAYDVLVESFQGKNLFLTYVPLERAINLMRQNSTFDCIAPAMESLRGLPNIYESTQSLYTYHDAAIVLSKPNLNIKNQADIFHYNVLAFPGAHTYFGQAFAMAAQKSQQYRELNHILQAIPMLFLKRIDVLILDKDAFIYHAWKQGYNYLSGENKVNFHMVFPPLETKIMCNKRHLIVMFDKAKIRLNQTGKSAQINEKNRKRMQLEMKEIKGAKGGG